MLQRLLWLSVAGAFGTVSRYSMCEACSKLHGGPFPLGTFVVNILGSFLFGLLYAFAQRKLFLTNELRVILLVGFMGAFTTFSTFAFDTAKMLRASQWMLAMGNVFAQVTCGIAALALGVTLARSI